MKLSRHVAPHRLVDAGQVGGRERARIERHVAGCARCAAVRERLNQARAAMAEIASQPAPELGWDHIGVRVYWSTSSARHAALREKQRVWWRRAPALALAGTLGVAAAAGFALTLWSSDRWPAGQGARLPASQSAPVASEPQAVAPSPLRGMVTFASGAVAIDGSDPDPRGAAALLDGPVAEGARLRTGEGRLVVQFGPSSGLALAPRSSVVLHRFDERVVELAVEDGAVEVQVSPRRQEQAFTVVAGRHRVSVQGTTFQVARRAGSVDVACTRGRVLVSDGASQVALAAGQQLQVIEQALLARATRQAIDPDRLAALERSLARPLLPAWTDSASLFETSSIVEMTAPLGRPVRVDGVEVGAGSFALRVMSGRHHLEVANASGGFGNGAWIDAEPRGRRAARAGADGVVRFLLSGGAGDAPEPGAVEADAAAPGRKARKVRRAQLDRALSGSARAGRCMEPLEKRDLVAGAMVLFDIGINADGSQGHLNIVHSNVPPEIERCLRGVVDEVELPSGPEATVRFKLAF